MVFKGIVNPQAILVVYYFLLSDEYNQSYIKKCPGSATLYNGSEWGLKFWSPIKVYKSIRKSAPHKSSGLKKAFWSESMSFCKKNIHI